MGGGGGGGAALLVIVVNREMENLSGGPTFGDFATILTEGSMQDVTIARLLSTRVQTPLSSLY